MVSRLAPPAGLGSVTLVRLPSASFSNFFHLLVVSVEVTRIASVTVSGSGGVVGLLHLDGSAQGIIHVLGPIDRAAGGVGKRYVPRLAEWGATTGRIERIYNRHGGAGDVGGGAGLVAGFHF